MEGGIDRACRGEDPLDDWPSGGPQGMVAILRFANRKPLGALGVPLALSKPMGYHFGAFGAPPILEPISVGVGMFTGGTGFCSMSICLKKGRSLNPTNQNRMRFCDPWPLGI